MTVQFEWDEHKNNENKRKHGVTFADAIEVFADKKRIILKDTKHSTKEKRLYCIGRCKLGIITVRFTNRNKIIRIFGAGKWRQGKKIYESKKIAV